MAHVPLEKEHTQEGIQAPGACSALEGDSPQPSPHLTMDTSSSFWNSDTPWWQYLMAITTDPMSKMDISRHTATTTPGFLCHSGAPVSPGAEGRSPESALDTTLPKAETPTRAQSLLSPFSVSHARFPLQSLL